MAIEFYALNGKNPLLDYNNFENSLNDVLKLSCKNAKLFILNQFPSPQSVNFDILILFSVMPDDSYDYYNVRNKSFFNVIMPVKFLANTENFTIEILEGELLMEGANVDYSFEISKIKSELQSYFINKLNFENVILNPLVFIPNKSNLVFKEYLISDKFDFYALDRYFAQSSIPVFNSYNNWKIHQKFYDVMLTDIKNILEQASKDSIFGYITKSKLDRLSRQISREKQIYENLGSSLFIIRGKPGTGKTSELLYILTRSFIEGKKALMLSYNRILLNEFSKTFNTFRNSKFDVIDKSHQNFKEKNNSKNNLGEGTILSFHQYFYRVSKSFGILSLMNAQRITDLTDKLNERVARITDFLSANSTYSNLDQIKNLCNNRFAGDEGLRKESLDYLNFFKDKKTSTIDLKYILSPEISKKYRSRKKSVIEQYLNKDVFLVDYPNVLKNTLNAILNFDEFFDKFDVENSYELLSNVWNLHQKKEISEDKLIPYKVARETFNRRIGGFKKKEIILIDEAQDCFNIEKELLYTIFTPEKIVIVDGGSEQLIRNQVPCNWKKYLRRDIPFTASSVRMKSTRQKKNLVKFLNFLAMKFNVPFYMETNDLEDHGEIVFDFRSQLDDKQVIDEAQRLLNTGKFQGCTPYESLLVFCDARENHIFDPLGIGGSDEATVDDDDVIIIKKSRKNIWKYLHPLKQNFEIWDGTIVNKKESTLPSSSDIRVLYYESCRGVEAWSTMCFDLDVLFEIKYQDNEAEKFIKNDGEADLFSGVLSEHQRRERFAAHWLIMGLTRAMDSVYIQVNGSFFDRQEQMSTPTRLPAILREYAASNPDVRVYG